VQLVQLTRAAAVAAPGPDQPTPQPFTPARKPGWLKVRAPGGGNYVRLKSMMRELNLHTVCEEARCPNIGECWEHQAATFMILGDVCTRNCAYCAVSHGTPKPFDPVEPVRLAEAVERMGLQHVVITSVDRDDLPNGGAEAFAGCVTEIRKRLPETTVEVLIPDFKGSEAALQLVMDARPSILNHNLETAERLYRLARPGGRYDRALRLLANARRMNAGALTKSGVILGMGEEWDEVLTCMRDLRRSDVNILTLGQYLRPSDGHLPVARYYTPEEFAELRDIGLAMGFTHVQASPLTRSSYHAWDQARAAGAGAAPTAAGEAELETGTP
jgi:lipoic acid synthetase